MFAIQTARHVQVVFSMLSKTESLTVSNIETVRIALCIVFYFVQASTVTTSLQ